MFSIKQQETLMKSFRTSVCAALVMFGAFLSTGCIVVDETRSTTTTRVETYCYDDCYDVEVCETWCDSWACWDECWWETTCDTWCEDVIIEETVIIEEETVVETGSTCSSNADCGNSMACVNDVCVAADSTDNGLAGLCQACEAASDCVEDGSLCIELSFDQATRTGEKVCTRPCEYNHECPSGFECINISSEVGTSAQCLPVITDWGERTCNPSPELECVRANDCGVGESCVANTCVAPGGAECSSQNPCGNGQTCVNFQCVAAADAECTRRSDCASGESCIDGECVGAAESCVFNQECDGGACVDGTCQSACSADADCGSNESCRSGLCQPLECRRSADCAAGNVCVDAKCEATCNASTGAGCADGYVCSNFGYCEADPGVECRTAAECARDEICDAGSCTTACSCNQQCGTGEVCNLDSGTCEDPNSPPAVSCANDCDCPSGDSCISGTCR